VRHAVLPSREIYSGFATELTGAFEAVPVVTGGELIISRLVFTRLVLISANISRAFRFHQPFIRALIHVNII
jgi:hypothetical protein